MEGRSGADANQTGPVTQAMDKIGPSSADSFPLALVIVGLLGLLLLAAGGASFLKQRVRGRRLRPGPPAPSRSSARGLLRETVRPATLSGLPFPAFGPGDPA